MRTRTRIRGHGPTGPTRPALSLHFFPIFPLFGLVLGNGDSVPGDDSFRWQPKSTVPDAENMTTATGGRRRWLQEVSLVGSCPIWPDRAMEIGALFASSSSPAIACIFAGGQRPDIVATRPQLCGESNSCCGVAYSGRRPDIGPERRLLLLPSPASPLLDHFPAVTRTAGDGSWPEFVGGCERTTRAVVAWPETNCASRPDKGKIRVCD